MPLGKVRMKRRLLLRGCALSVAIAVVGLGCLLGALWLEHGSPVALPVPTGPFAVGRSVSVWGDDTPDRLAPTPDSRRQLLVWIWYPAPRGNSTATAAYVPPELQRNGRARGAFIIRLLTHDASVVRDRSLKHAALANAARPFPVLVMRAGASAPVVHYSTLAEDLASHGYVVIGFDAPYRTGFVTFPDGRTFDEPPRNNPELVFGAPDSAQRINRILGAWTGDIGFVLSRLATLTPAGPSGFLAGRVDLTRVGIFGHSLGGAEAAAFCGRDARCRAGADIDGAPLGRVVTNGIPRPFMFLLSGQLHMGGRRQLAVTSYCLRTFFDAYLKGIGATPPAIASRAYPEVRLLRASIRHP